MRIGVNCVRLVPSYKGGVNSFALGLLDGFAASRRGHDFVIFASRRNRDMFQKYASLPNFQVVLLDRSILRVGRALFNRIPWPLRFRLPYRHIGHLLNDGDERKIASMIDVHYVPNYPTPIFPLPAVPTIFSIHDLQHVHLPQFFTAKERRERDVCFANAIDHAALIQASSHAMAKDFAAQFPNLPERKIVIIPEGVNVAAFAAASPGDVRERYGLPERFLFFPAQLWPHKNHITILRALDRLRAEGLEIALVLTGGRFNGTDELTAYLEKGAATGIHYLGVVPYPDIIALHRAARFLITASLFESSSLPVLEACAAGTPVIASAIPAHIEHAHDFQMQLFPPADDAALAALLRQIWNDDDLIARQTAHNSVAIQAFSWNHAAERYIDTFEALHVARQRPA
jgi:glycosyltransferase involved in cell wall biosynthesis